MKVSYDNTSKDYAYPMSRTDLDKLQGVVASPLLAAISVIRFGCNTKTTQEGRTVQRGNQYEIRINFCLRNNRSRLLSTEKSYERTIQSFGGQINKEASLITWSTGSAKLYAFYLLLHEIAHVAYCERFKEGKLEGHGSPTEEAWCDKYASDTLRQLRALI